LNSKKILFITLCTLFFIGVLLWVFIAQNTSKKKDSKKISHLHGHKHHHINKESFHDHIKSSQTKTEFRKNQLESLSISVEYKFTKDIVYQWIQNYPETRQKLLEVATSEDPYVTSNVQVKPHTTHEIKQQKYGALRVMALRALFDKEPSKSKKEKNLQYIIQNAKDNVIKDIAKSIFKSHQKGRDYTKDFIEAASP